MPQVDLETRVSASAGGGSTDRKIACEAQAETTDDEPENNDVQDTEPIPGSDLPPESFWLSKDAEFDWFDRNAFYERKESTKGITHSSSTHIHPSATSTSQRFSINSTSKGSIIGLPKTQKASYVDGKRSNGTKPANIRLFRRPTTIGKQTSVLTEPSSPKVSCMGRVRSKRKSRRSTEPVIKRKEKPVERSRSSNSREKRKTGFGSKFMAIFRAGKSQKKPVQASQKSTIVEAAPRKSLSASKRVRENPVSVELVDTPGLGGMKRFASGRKSTEEYEGVITGSLNLDRRVGPT